MEYYINLDQGHKLYSIYSFFLIKLYKVDHYSLFEIELFLKKINQQFHIYKALKKLNNKSIINKLPGDTLAKGLLVDVGNAHPLTLLKKSLYKFLLYLYL